MATSDNNLPQKDFLTEELLERRIYCWLEEQRIYQVSPDEKKNDFFYKNKGNFKNSKSQSFKGFSLKNSILLKRRNTTQD